MRIQEEIQKELSQHSLLKGLHPWYREQLERYAEIVVFESGDYIFRKGAPADDFFIIIHGNVVLSESGDEGGEVVVSNLGRGDILGWSWLIPPYRWRFDARAVDPLTMISLRGKYLRAKCEEDREMGYEIMKRMVYVIIDRLQATRQQLIASVSHAGTETD